MGSSPTRSVIFAPGSRVLCARIAASRSPAIQPWVRRSSSSRAPWSTSMPSMAKYASASSAVQARSAPLMSASSPDTRSRASCRAGGCRADSTSRSVPGACRMIRSRPLSTAGSASSCTSSRISTTGSVNSWATSTRRSGNRSGLVSSSARSDVGRDGAQPGQRRAQVGPEPGVLVLGVHRQPGHPAALRGRAGPGGAGHRLARAGRPADQRDPVAGGLVEQAGDPAAAQHREVRLRDLQLALKKPRRRVHGGTGRHGGLAAIPG